MFTLSVLLHLLLAHSEHATHKGLHTTWVWPKHPCRELVTLLLHLQAAIASHRIWWLVVETYTILRRHPPSAATSWHAEDDATCATMETGEDTEVTPACMHSEVYQNLLVHLLFAEGPITAASSREKTQVVPASDAIFWVPASSRENTQVVPV